MLKGEWVVKFSVRRKKADVSLWLTNNREFFESIIWCNDIISDWGCNDDEFLFIYIQLTVFFFFLTKRLKFSLDDRNDIIQFEFEWIEQVISNFLNFSHFSTTLISFWSSPTLISFTTSKMSLVIEWFTKEFVIFLKRTKFSTFWKLTSLFFNHFFSLSHDYPLYNIRYFLPHIYIN